jgi:hypothetical protein
LKLRPSTPIGFLPWAVTSDSARCLCTALLASVASSTGTWMSHWCAA